MFKFMIATVAMLGVATAACATDAKNDAQQTPPTIKQKKLCRIDDDTGSVRTKRVCHTAEEWHAIDDANAHNARTLLGGRSGAHDGPGT